MWWCRRIRGGGPAPVLGLAAVVGMLLLAGCTLRPLYSDEVGERIRKELAAIEVSAPETRLGWLLRNRVIEDLRTTGTAEAARYRLELRPSESREAVAIQLNDSVTRFNLTLSILFRLFGKDGRRLIYEGTVTRVASYDVVRDPFATLIADQDAEKRAGIEASRAIRTRLALFFAGSDR